MKITNAEKVAKILIFLRETENLTKRDLSKKLGIKYTTYNNYETGRTEPNIENLINIADCYKITIDYLVGRNFSNEFGYMSDDEKALVRGFRDLNHINQVRIISQLQGLLIGQN